MCMREAGKLKKLCEEQQVFIMCPDVLKSMNTAIGIGNASVILLIIRRGIEVKTNWAGRDRKQDLTRLCQTLVNLNRDCTMCPVIRTIALGQIIPVKTCLRVLACQPQLREDNIFFFKAKLFQQQSSFKVKITQATDEKMRPGSQQRECSIWANDKLS